MALADKEIAVPPNSLKAQFKLEWVKADELRVSGIIEQKQRNGQIKRIQKGITKKDLGVLLETYRQKPILEAARDELIQSALSCLRDLGIIKEHDSPNNNQGYWKFSLFLKCKATREENLQVIRDKWKEAFGELPEIQHPPQLTATLNRCILGLKGDSPLTWESLQHLPLYCLNADLLADETREREIALTLSELIWEITCPDEDPPEPATPAELRRHLKTLKRAPPPPPPCHPLR